jgi:uncharacterized protein YdiU (UPF0061 family)
MSRSPVDAGWNFEHSYCEMPELFFKKAHTASFAEPRLLAFNDELAETLGLDPETLEQPESAAFFTGNLLPTGAQLIAQAYAGHQFGNFTGLGDGRAMLLGEQITPSGQRFDIQLKGAGRTPFSRGGDGLAAIGPMLREFLISEAMHALNIPTTRSLAVATTGEMIFRNEELPGAVLTRVAASHIRVGTFQWAAAHDDVSALRALANYTRRRHFPEFAEGSHADFFRAVLDRQASLIAKWLSVGFIHGVMNTDNTAISGETIDYGPCAFLDQYDPGTVFSSIDRQGRYAYSQQASIVRWNLARLAETLIPLLHEDQNQAIDLANEALHQFQDIFQNHWLGLMRGKLGIFNAEPQDNELVQALLDWMHQNQQDFTLSFRALSNENAHQHPLFPDGKFIEWYEAWQARLERQQQSSKESIELMRQNNPIVIPRNHKVEEALSAATLHGEMAPFEALLSAIRNPFEEPNDPSFAKPPVPSAIPYRTFCGT